MVAGKNSVESRPINLGRNHWKLAVILGSFIDVVVAPLTWGGIIGNADHRKVSMTTKIKSRPINLGRNHWKRGLVVVRTQNRASRPINLGRNHWKP